MAEPAATPLLRIVLAWVFGALGLYHLVLWARLRRFPEYLWFGLVSITLGVNAFVASRGLDAIDPAEGLYTRALSGNFHLILALFPLFFLTTLGRPPGRVARGYALLNVGLATFMLGLGGPAVFHAMKPVRLVVLAPMAVTMLAIAVREAWRGNREARTLALAGLPLFVASIHDRIGELQGGAVGWSTLAFALFVLGMALMMADRFGRAYGALEAREMELAALNEATSRFVPFPFLRLLGKRDIREVNLGEGIERDITVLFSDIRSFTSLSETMSPEENFRFINDYLGHMEPCVEQAHGFIDKYIGDAVMALFPRTPDDGVRAALAMLAALDRWNEERAAAGEPAVQVGIGLNTGPCMLGTIGGPRRMDGTVIADAVNLAARIEGMTKRYGARVVLSEASVAGLTGPFTLREVDRVAVKGKSAPVALFEVLDGEPPALQAAKLATRSTFARALQAFRDRDWDAAAAGFAACLATAPEDGAARLYGERCRRLAADDPGPTWDGVVRMEEK